MQMSEDVEVVHDVENNMSTITPSSIVAMTKCGNIAFNQQIIMRQTSKLVEDIRKRKSAGITSQHAI